MHGSIRLHVAAPLAAEAIVDVTPAQAHYLGAVMRRGAGDMLRLFNGREGEWEARIVALKRERGQLVAVRRLRPQRDDEALWLVFVPLKRDATELVVQKATELGVAALLPALTERGNVPRLNIDRLRAIAVEAAEQSERLTVPEIGEPQRLAALLGAWPGDRPLIAAIERAAAPRLRPTHKPAGLLIGPEGGFSPGELDELARHAFVRPVSLGPRILRAETAAIVGLALLQGPGSL